MNLEDMIGNSVCLCVKYLHVCQGVECLHLHISVCITKQGHFTLMYGQRHSLIVLYSRNYGNCYHCRLL